MKEKIDSIADAMIAPIIEQPIEQATKKRSGGPKPPAISSTTDEISRNGNRPEYAQRPVQRQAHPSVSTKAVEKAKPAETMTAGDMHSVSVTALQKRLFNVLLDELEAQGVLLTTERGALVFKKICEPRLTACLKDALTKASECGTFSFRAK